MSIGYSDNNFIVSLYCSRGYSTFLRHNAGVTITSGRGSESVTVRKIKTVPAGKAILAPLENVPPFNDHFLSNALANIAIVKGDTVIVPHFDGRLSFQVIDMLPSIDERDGYTVRPVIDTDAFLVNFHSEFEICPLNPHHSTKVKIRNLKPWNVEELK